MDREEHGFKGTKRKRRKKVVEKPYAAKRQKTGIRTPEMGQDLARNKNNQLS